MTDGCVGPEQRVTLHFAIKLATGALVDSTFDKKPATFKVGDGSLLPGFEQVLFGLRVGDRRSFELPPSSGFGPRNPNNVQKMSRSQFDGMALSEGLMVLFNDAAKAPLPGVVRSFDDQWVTVDFNHPLAGESLIFEVEILDIHQ